MKSVPALMDGFVLLGTTTRPVKIKCIINVVCACDLGSVVCVYACTPS